MEKFTKIDHLRPYYNWTSNSVHGGSRGFDYLGVPENEQGEFLFIGPSDYGLTDRIHSVALSLMHTTLNVLLLKKYPEMTKIMHMLIMFCDEIGRSALEISNPNTFMLLFRFRYTSSHD